MPTYEYACDACGHAWEAFQSIKDDPLTKCPSCKKKKAKRQISAGTGFILKGGGWYSDLYASQKPGGSKGEKGEQAGKDSSSKSEGASSSGADAAKSPKPDKSEKVASSGASKSSMPPGPQGTGGGSAES